MGIFQAKPFDQLSQSFDAFFTLHLQCGMFPDISLSLYDLPSCSKFQHYLVTRCITGQIHMACHLKYFPKTEHPGVYIFYAQE